MKEKLLILGVDTSTEYALSYAKSTGAMTIITDYSPVDSHPVKQMADEVWTVDVKDLDTLERRCRENQVTGVYAGNSEFCLDMAKELAKRLNLPFYASEEGWMCARNKAKFKEYCLEAGLDVPKHYPLTDKFEPEVLSEIVYPVIVKPVDSCAKKGISVCRNEEELRQGIDKALMYSKKKEVIVEDYIEGKEVEFIYLFVDGRPVLIEVRDLLYVYLNECPIFSFDRYQSDHINGYEKKLKDKVNALFEKMECKKGTAFLQTICREGNYYFIEMNYRMDGSGTYLTDKRNKGYSRIEYMVDMALGRDITEKYEMFRKPLAYNGVGACYLTLANAGKIKKIIGLDEVKALDGIEFTLERYREGDEIKASNDMFQIAYYIGLWAETKEKLVEKVRFINGKLHILDENGSDLLVPFEDYDELS